MFFIFLVRCPLIWLCGIHGEWMNECMNEWMNEWMNEYGTFVDWYWQGSFKLLGQKPVPVPRWLPQILHGMFWDRTRIIWLKWSLSYNIRIGTNFVSLRIGPVCGCCDYGNEPTAMVKSGECFDQLSKCWLPKEGLVLLFVQSILSGLRQNHWSLSVGFVLHNRLLDH
jgi:hypothetical protein